MSAIGERQFGPYRLVHQIAVGGMAEIHLAKTHGIAGFEKYVALKMIHPNFSQDSHFIQMLIDEAKITVQLQHVNIAQTFDLGRVGDTFYITMEYVDGVDLYKLLRRSSELDRVFPIALCAFIGKEVTSGLDYAHRKRDHNGRPLRIVHRDVSPQNVLISYAGEVKLVDFGIAKATMRARQTAAGVIKGKYYYMSPEQAWGEPLDHRTDVFSAGILLYETLTGQMLYLDEDLHKLLDKVRRAEIPPPSTLRNDIPPQLDAIVMRALSKQPEGRYSSAADMAHELERFLHAYAPVFTANKVSTWIAEVIGHPAPTPVPHQQEVISEESPVPEHEGSDHGGRGQRGETRRLTRDQLVRARSDFTDDNSIIFAAFEDDRPEGAAGSDDDSVLDENSTFDASLPGVEADVDSLPEAPRDHVASGRSSARAVPAPVRPDRVTAKLPELSRESLPAVPDPPTRRRSPGLPGMTPGPVVSRGSGKAPEDDASSSRPVVPAPGGQLSGTQAAQGGRSSGQAASGRSSGVQATARDAVPRPAAPRARDQDTRLLLDAAPLRRPGEGRSVSLSSSPTLLSDEDSGTSHPDDATVISEGPNWWSGPGDMTEVADAPFGEPTFVSPPADDNDGPTLHRAPAVVSPPTPRPGSWERAPALAAKVSQPAVSQLRPPRGSRRTPAGGVPGLAQGQSDAATSGTRDRALNSVLASLLSSGDSTGAAEVALSPPTRLDAEGDRDGREDRGGREDRDHHGDSSDRSERDHRGDRSDGGERDHRGDRDAPTRRAHKSSASRRSARPSPPPGLADAAQGSGAIDRVHGQSFPPPEPAFPVPAMPAPQPFSTRALVAALERDEIPDHYKIGRRTQPTPWIIGLLALILSATVAVTLLAIYGTGESDAAGGDAVVELISIPPGAKVTVDGEVLPSPTPTEIRGAPGARFLLRFELPHHQVDEEEFVVPEQGDVHQVVARLDANVVKLSVDSVPQGAEVFIGGNSVGRTPVTLPGLDPQSTTSIEVRLRGFRPVRQPLDWASKAEERLVIELER
jgi:serine/threonine protein kinase